MTDTPLDLFVDLNSMDETGLPWSFIDEATDPSRVVVGAFIVVGGGSVRAVAQVVDITDEGIVHVRPLSGALSDHLICCKAELLRETTAPSRSSDVVMSSAIDLVADLNAQDDEGLCWSTLSSAVDPSLIGPGAVLIAGNVQARARVRVVAVDVDGQVHFEILRSPTSAKLPTTSD